MTIINEYKIFTKRAAPNLSNVSNNNGSTPFQTNTKKNNLIIEIIRNNAIKPSGKYLFNSAGGYSKIKPACDALKISSAL